MQMSPGARATDNTVSKASGQRKGAMLISLLSISGPGSVIALAFSQAFTHIIHPQQERLRPNQGDSL